MSTDVKKLPKQVIAQLEQVAEIEKDIAGTEPPIAVEPPPVPVAPVAAAPVVIDPPKDDDWKQKFLTMQGIVTANNAERQVLAGKLAVAEAKLEALTQAPPEPKPAPAAKPTPLLTTADTEAFGPEMIDVITRAAQQVARDTIAEVNIDLEALRRENTDLKAKLGGVAEQQGETARNTYYSELTKVVPDWRAYDTDPRFVEWLKATDPLTGLQRQAYLNAAWEGFDVQRTANLFNAWLSTVAPITPAADPAPAPAPVNPLDRQVQPNSSGNVPVQQPDAADTKVFSAKEVQTFYSDVTKGRFKGREAERLKLEQQIDAAAASGRVR